MQGQLANHLGLVCVPQQLLVCRFVPRAAVAVAVAVAAIFALLSHCSLLLHLSCLTRYRLIR